MNTKYLPIILAACVLPTSGIAAKPKAADPQPSREIVYKTVDGMDLKLHVFDPAADTKKPMPAIVFFFGGGWSGGSPSQFYHQSKYLAGQGVLAISAEYRTRKNGGVEPSECVKDGKAAMRYVRAHAEELGVDPDRIAAGGGSAGGHVAAATGTVKGFEHDGEDLTVSSRPNAMVLFNPVYDNSPEGYGNSRVKDYWKEFSPLHNITKETPPTIAFFGSKEKLVTRAAMEAFRDKQKALGTRSVLKVYEGPGHGFFNHGRDGNKWFLATMTEAHGFLADCGWVTGEPAVAEYLGMEPAAGGRTSLFDGKTLNGWKVLTCEAKVDDGEILIVSGNGLIQTEKKYGDFILEFDWKKLGEEMWDSGVYFRYDTVPPKRPWPNRYQVNLRKGMEGNVGGIEGAKSEGLINPDEWNHFKLTVKGTTLALEINGKQAWKGDGLDEPMTGFIALQAEVPGGGQHRFRNVFVTEL
jgi:acetyl esterase/lipase